jgi:hypothetical protein
MMWTKKSELFIAETREHQTVGRALKQRLELLTERESSLIEEAREYMWNSLGCRVEEPWEEEKTAKWLTQM